MPDDLVAGVRAHGHARGLDLDLWRGRRWQWRRGLRGGRSDRDNGGRCCAAE
jgi:hypothetical protein